LDSVVHSSLEKTALTQTWFTLILFVFFQIYIWISTSYSAIIIAQVSRVDVLLISLY